MRAGTLMASAANSIGVLTSKDKTCLIAVLTDDNSAEQYGIDTIEGVARPVQRDLNAPARGISRRVVTPPRP